MRISDWSSDVCSSDLIEQRHKLVHWSNVLTADRDDPESPVRTETERQAGLQDFYVTMMELWQRRQKEEQSYDIISLLAHDEGVRSASFDEICALFGLFLVGGNDTTRNSMSGDRKSTRLNSSP